MTAPDSAPPGSAAPTTSATPAAEPRGWWTEAWYQLRIWTLALLALLVVAFMVSAMLLSIWPHLAGPYEPLVKKDDNPVQQPDRREMRERWKIGPGPDNPIGRTPMDAYRNGATGPPTASPTQP